MRPNLLIAGIINVITGIGWVYFGGMTNNVCLGIGAFVIVVGIIFISYSRMQIQEVNEKKKLILLLSIFSSPFSFLATIVSAIEYDNIKRDYARYRIDNNIQDSDSTKTVNSTSSTSKETKKVDILLKIGVVMIALSGIMIVTSSWETITSTIKLVLLILVGFVFVGLSVFSEFKLKIRNTTLAYWLLSMTAFGLSFYLIGYEQMIGDWFSIGGDGELVFFMSMSLVIGILSYITYKKFKITGFLYTSYIALLFAVLFLLRQMEDEPKIYVLIIASILLFINILPVFKKEEFKVIKNFSMIVTYVLTVFVLVELSEIKDDILVSINLVIQSISLIAIAIRQKTDTSKVLSGLSLMLLLFTASNYLLADFEEINRIIITRSIFIALAIFVCAVIVRNHKSGSLIMGFAMPIILGSMMSKINIVIAIYVGCVALLMIIFGLIVNKNYKILYIEGIIFTILNLVIQLTGLWGEIPAWLYLLVCGFVLIGIVTIKELKKDNKTEISNNYVNSQEVKSEPVVENIPEDAKEVEEIKQVEADHVSVNQSEDNKNE